MEFVLVTFPRVRPVRMDGATQGQTGQVLAVQRGVHIFDLGSPPDYTPPSVQTTVANTTSGAPLVVAFQDAAFAPPPAPPPPPAPIEFDAPRAGGGARSRARTSARRKRAPSRRKAAAKKTAASKKSAAPKKKAASRRTSAGRKKSGAKTR